MKPTHPLYVLAFALAIPTIVSAQRGGRGGGGGGGGGGYQWYQKQQQQSQPTSAVLSVQLPQATVAGTATTATALVQPPVLSTQVATTAAVLVQPPVLKAQVQTNTPIVQSASQVSSAASAVSSLPASGGGSGGGGTTTTGQYYIEVSGSVGFTWANNGGTGAGAWTGQGSGSGKSCFSGVPDGAGGVAGPGGGMSIGVAGKFGVAGNTRIECYFPNAAAAAAGKKPNCNISFVDGYSLSVVCKSASGTTFGYGGNLWAQNGITCSGANVVLDSADGICRNTIGGDTTATIGQVNKFFQAAAGITEIFWNDGGLATLSGASDFPISCTVSGGASGGAKQKRDDDIASNTSEIIMDTRDLGVPRRHVHRSRTHARVLSNILAGAKA